MTLPRRTGTDRLLIPAQAVGEGVVGDGAREIGPEDPAYPAWLAWLQRSEVEDKSARHVRSPEGAVRYGEPIGSLIVGHPRTPAPRAGQMRVAPAGGTAPSTALSDTQFTARTEMIEKVLGEKIAGRQTSDAMFTLDGQGKVWAPERAAQHKAIVDDLYAKAVAVPNDGKAMMAGGLGGAGKSTVLRDYAGVDQSQFLTVNPDDVKALMVERGMVPEVEGLSPMEASPLIHEESSHIANLLAARAYAEKKNMIWDITMASKGSVERRIRELRDNGYGTVDAVFVDIPVEMSVARATSRYRRGADAYLAGKGAGGRYVPPSVIRKNVSTTSSSANRDVFNALEEEFDGWQLYDNSGTAPVLLSVGGQGDLFEGAP